MSRHFLKRACFAVLIAIVATSRGVTASAPDAIVLDGTIVTMNATRDVMHNGHVLIRGGRIIAVWQGANVPAGVDTMNAQRVPVGPQAYIYPGLINLHDHPFFDMLPLWQPPSSHRQPAVGRPLGTEPYDNRYQWNAGPPPVEELRLVANASGMLTQATGLNRLVEVIKFGKARMILGGTTTTQGGGFDAAYDSLLSRNVEAMNFDRQRVFSRVGAIGSISAVEEDMVASGMAAGLIDAWLVHLAEGVRDGDRQPDDSFSSRSEFATLKSKKLLTDATVIVHGVGLEATDFEEMAAAPAARSDGTGDGRGAKLVWSPLSNLLLYGKTASIYDALAAGVLVSLGTDWTPSGSPNLLTEMKIADRVLRDGAIAARRHVVPGLTIGAGVDHGAAERALDQLLVEMVTINPARTVRWDDQVGSIEPGKVADLLVIESPSVSAAGGLPPSPYRRLIDATERDVELVMVGGVAQAGSVAVMTALKPGDFEVIASDAGCFEKAIDLTSPALPKGAQTFAEVKQLVSDGLRSLGGDHPPAGGGPSSPFANTWSYLKARIPGASGLPDAIFNFALAQAVGVTPDGKTNIEAIALPPDFVADDQWWLSTIEARRDPSTGLTDTTAAPYALYPSNANQISAAGNLFAADVFRNRWYWSGCR